MRSATNPIHSTFSNPNLGAFPLTKLSPRWLVGKVYLFSFWNILNFWSWRSFAPSKVESPKISSCVSQKWQRGHFCYGFLAFRWPISAPNLMKLSRFAYFFMLNLKMQTILPKSAPIKSAVPPIGISCVAKFKIWKLQNFTKIVQKLAQGTLMYCFDELMKNQLGFPIRFAPFCFSKPSSIVP